MPNHWSRFSVVGIVSILSLIVMPSVSHAESFNVRVIHRSTAAGLPHTPAYAGTAVSRDLHLLSTNPHTRIINAVVDSKTRIQALASYSSSVSNPKSRFFHHFLTAQQLDRAFGPTPAMIQAAEASMTAAGWHVIAHKGLVVTARVPASASHPGLPISPDIWSMTGLAPHGIIRNPAAAAPVRVQNAATVKPNFSLSGEDFNQSPQVLQQTTESNGDVVSVMSWNPNVSTSVPTGLPINLFVTVEDPQGNFLPIRDVSNLNDTNSSLVSYGTAAMPGTSDTLWQMPLAAWKDVPPGDLLTLQITLNSGVSLNASFPLPQFTGSATALTPLDGQQMNKFSGLGQVPRNPGPIALFAIGSPPSLKDLSLYLAQNTTSTTAPLVTFRFEDGATANEYGQSADSQESELDLQAASGAAPGAPIYDYVFPENDQNDPLISYLTDLSQQNTIKIASLSYGFYGEDPNTLTTLMNALTAEGVTVIEASGDQGAWNSGTDPGPVGLSSLEQVPSVLSVGGLDLAAPATTDASGNTVAITGSPIAKAWGGYYLNGIPVAAAQAYTNQNAASSGGYSTSTAIPTWQQGFLPPGSSGFGVPIISAMAGYPGMSGYLQGQNVVYGGTSLAAPLTAGWLDEVEAALNLTSTGLGNVNPLLFQAAALNPSTFTQALWGADGVYTITDNQAGSWNPVTGLGMVNWDAFLTDYNTMVPDATPAVTLTAPGRAPIERPVTVTAYVRGLTNPLYQFSYRSPENGVQTLSGPFSPQNTYSFVPKVPGQYVTQVHVKSSHGTILVGEQVVTVMTTLPMVSSLAVTSSVAGNAVKAGGSISIQGHAGDIGLHPEYQFWLRGLNGTWHIVQGWGPKSILTLKHLKAGRYAVEVMALDRVEVLHHNWAAAYRRTITLAMG